MLGEMFEITRQFFNLFGELFMTILYLWFMGSGLYTIYKVVRWFKEKK